MRMLHRGLAAAALSAPLALGLSGVATADEFEHSESSTGPQGASTSHVQSRAGSNGDSSASYEKTCATAGPQGASSCSTESTAGDDSHTGHSGDNGGHKGGSSGGLLGGLLS